MKPLLAIFNVENDYFTEKWIDYCDQNEISYEKIYEINSSTLNKIKKCDGFLWHWNLIDFKNYFIAKELIHTVNVDLNIPCFPDYKTIWHYDDKIAQEFLFETVDIKKPKHWFFFNKIEALNWIDEAEFPVVFKLRKGSGSRNVRLIKNKIEAKKIIAKMFGKGIKPQLVTLKIAKESKVISRIFKIGLKQAVRYFFSSAKFPREQGYVYFQEFIPECDRDYRVIVVGDKIAYGFIRLARENDFRASGSGSFLIDHTEIDPEMVKTSFHLSEKLEQQIVCLDFIKRNQEIFLLEMSYDFVPAGGTYNSKWHGYWDQELNWIQQEVDPVILILEDLLKEIKKRKK